MSVQPSEVRWSSYDKHEGPMFSGRCPLKLSTSPSWSEMVMWVVSASEGHLDSINAYDRAVMSVGVIQWTENPRLHVSSMLGLVAERAPSALAELDAALAMSDASFGQMGDGRWRFRRDGAWVETPQQLRDLYLGGASGLKGEWTDAARAHAKAWAAAIASVFSHPEAQKAQVDFTAPKLETFAFEPARRILWDGTCPENDGLHGAVRAMFLSYAINLPSVSSKRLLAVKSSAPKWSADWADDVLRSFVLESGVAIWPERYNRIRPRLEAAFGVDLPDHVAGLRGEHDDGLASVAGIQRALTALGFEPGPIDGQWGRKSALATRRYQQARGLAVDGVVGPATRARLREDLNA
jgi:hypothetical protein